MWQERWTKERNQVSKERQDECKESRELLWRVRLSESKCTVIWKYYPNIYTIVAFIIVPSMMPRPILTSFFALTYRKIPVLAINQDVCYQHQQLILASALASSY